MEIIFFIVGGIIFILIAIGIYKDFKEDREIERKFKKMREERATNGKSKKEKIFSQAYLANLLSK